MPVPINVVSLPDNISALPWTGERFIPGVKGQVEMEHLHRYIAAMQLCHGKEVLDIASGEGYGCYILAQVAKKVTGVDIDAETIAFAAEKYAEKTNMHFKAGSCAAIPLEDNSLDVVISFETIEHIAEQQAFVAEVKRILRKDGVFIVSTPDRVVATPLDSPANPYHVRELYRDEFYHMLKTKFKEIVFFGQRSITGSLIFPDGRTVYDTPNEAIFFATADKAHKIECVEFFPRAQNIIAIVSDADISSFSASVYEGVFGTLDILNAEYDNLYDDHNKLLKRQEQAETQISHIPLLLESQKVLNKQKDALQISLLMIEKMYQIQKQYLYIENQLEKIMNTSPTIWDTEKSFLKNMSLYTECQKLSEHLSAQLSEGEQKLQQAELLNGQLGAEYSVLQGKLFRLFVDISNLRSKVQEMLKQKPKRVFFFRRVLRSLRYRLGLVA